MKSDEWHMVYDTYRSLGFNDDECYLRAERYAGVMK